jgi:hypothetical protein
MEVQRITVPELVSIYGLSADWREKKRRVFKE